MKLSDEDRLILERFTASPGFKNKPFDLSDQDATLLVMYLDYLLEHPKGSRTRHHYGQAVLDLMDKILNQSEVYYDQNEETD